MKTINNYSKVNKNFFVFFIVIRKKYKDNYFNLKNRWINHVKVRIIELFNIDNIIHNTYLYTITHYTATTYPTSLCKKYDTDNKFNQGGKYINEIEREGGKSLTHWQGLVYTCYLEWPIGATWLTRFSLHISSWLNRQCYLADKV